MITIPLNARVMCRDGEDGKSTSIIADPVTHKVTHFVAKDNTGKERIVPINQVKETTADTIFLNCNLEELSKMETFYTSKYVVRSAPAYDHSVTSSGGYYHPYVVASTEVGATEVSQKRVPKGELSIERGTKVHATDGEIGKVDEFLIDPDSGEITHVILERGRILDKKEIAIPLSAVERVAGDVVYLKLDKEAIRSLPAVAVSRPWEEISVTDVEILVGTFNDAGKAAELLEALKKLEREYETGIHNAAVLTKDASGKASIHEAGDIDPRRGALFGAITGGLFGLLGGPVGAVIGAVAGAATGGVAAGKIDMGFPDEFLKQTEDTLQPGTSAIVVLVDRSSDDVITRLVEDSGGKLIRQTLPDEQVARLLKNIDEAGNKPS